MRCEQARKKLWGLVDRDLSARVREGLEAHVAQCAGCRDELEALRELDAVLGGEPRVDAPQGMATAIARKAAARWLMRRRVMIPGWLEALSFAGVGAAGAAVGLVGVRLVMAVGEIEVSVGNAVGVVGIAAAATLAAFGAAYYRA